MFAKATCRQSESTAYPLLNLPDVESSLRPYFRHKHLLTPTELSFYEVLRRVVYDYVVFAKVRVADLIDANARHRSWQANFNRVCSKHIDFVICDDDSRPLLAVELDGNSHERPDRVARDDDVDGLFEAVSFPLLRVPAETEYDFDRLRALVVPVLKSGKRGRNSTA